MKFLIYRQAKSAMQSGKLNSKKWLVEPIENENSRSINQLMHWVSSNDTKTQMRFEFLNKEDAIDFAKKNNFVFEVVEPQESTLKPKSYSENFTK